MNKLLSTVKGLTVIATILLMVGMFVYSFHLLSGAILMLAGGLIGSLALLAVFKR
ncbi:MAG: hypothetical protein HKN68_20780 [Saprospiraceae bacterium]|nr:hypothetical protein [Saprospiraceae bacterium]